MRKFSCCIFFLLFVFQAMAQENVPAFPGADGFGKFTTGGRGGKVYIVTNLNDSGPGSLREAVKKKEKRTIVFAVAGTIALESNLNISSGDVTIAGQSAPGDGICIKNYQVTVNADNVIVRYLRFRLGDEAKQQADAFSGTGHSNIIIDHCSMSWATDECASFYRNKNFTMQWCIISESLNRSVHEKGDHGYGGIWGGEKASFHHNLIAHHNSRLPRFSGSSTTPNSPDELVDFRNNVIYNWMGNGTYGGEKGRYNMVGNYYKAGPATSRSKAYRILSPDEPYGQFFIKDNFVNGAPEMTADNKKGIISKDADAIVVSEPFDFMYEENEDPLNAFDAVLHDAGASFSRDAIDNRVVDEVKSGGGKNGKGGKGIIDSQKDVGGWPELKGEAQADKDQDGIPDDWEKSHQLDASNVADGNSNTLDKIYTNIEVYLNDILKSKK